MTDTCAGARSSAQQYLGVHQRSTQLSSACYPGQACLEAPCWYSWNSHAKIFWLTGTRCRRQYRGLRSVPITTVKLSVRHTRLLALAVFTASQSHTGKYPPNSHPDQALQCRQDLSSAVPSLAVWHLTSTHCSAPARCSCVPQARMATAPKAELNHTWWCRSASSSKVLRDPDTAAPLIQPSKPQQKPLAAAQCAPAARHAKLLTTKPCSSGSGISSSSSSRCC